MVCACSAAKCVLIRMILMVTMVRAVEVFMLRYVAAAVLTRLDAVLTYHSGEYCITVLWLILCILRLLEGIAIMRA